MRHIDEAEESEARLKRRRIVGEFLQRRSYWPLMNWLSEETPKIPSFWALSEAVEHYGHLLRTAPTDWVRTRYVAARYFERAGHGWLR